MRTSLLVSGGAVVLAAILLRRREQLAVLLLQRRTPVQPPRPSMSAVVSREGVCVVKKDRSTPPPAEGEVLITRAFAGCRVALDCTNASKCVGNISFS